MSGGWLSFLGGFFGAALGQEPRPASPPSSAPAGKAVEMVDELYWLKWAVKAVDDAIPARDAAAQRLATAIGWFWTVYTVAAVVGVRLSEQQISGPQRALIFAPTGVLVAAYLSCLWALMPVTTKLPFRRPARLQAAHQRVVDAKRFKLAAAGVLTLLAAVIVVVAAAVTAFADKAVGGAPRLAVSAAASENPPAIVVALAGLPAGQSVLLTVQQRPPDTGVVNSLVFASGDGRVSQAISLPAGWADYSVIASWEADSLRHSLEKTIR